LLPKRVLCHFFMQVRGLGLEGEAAAEEALLYTLRERPGGPDQLLVGSRPAALVCLAALAESCDWVADCLRNMAAAAAGAESTLLKQFTIMTIDFEEKHSKCFSVSLAALVADCRLS
jgi:hypothetical protein